MERFGNQITNPSTQLRILPTNNFSDDPFAPKMKVRKKCIHIGGKWSDEPGGRKNPMCKMCPDHPNNIKYGLEPGDFVDW